jgi:hypothetical protein
MRKGAMMKGEQMDRHAYASLVCKEIANALDELLPSHAATGQVSRVLLERRLEILANHVEIAARRYYLLGMKPVDELADELGVDVKHLRIIAEKRHEHFGVGRKFGDTWVWAPDEIDVMLPAGE